MSLQKKAEEAHKIFEGLGPKVELVSKKFLLFMSSGFFGSHFSWGKMDYSLSTLGWDLDSTFVVNFKIVVHRLGYFAEVLS